MILADTDPKYTQADVAQPAHGRPGVLGENARHRRIASPSGDAVEVGDVGCRRVGLQAGLGEADGVGIIEKGRDEGQPGVAGAKRAGGKVGAVLVG